LFQKASAFSGFPSKGSGAAPKILVFPPVPAIGGFRMIGGGVGTTTGGVLGSGTAKAFLRLGDGAQIGGSAGENAVVAVGVGN
jgi:hypothetical protein